MKLRVQLATTPADVLRCQYAIAEVYNREYEVVFSTDRYDLDAKIEPWPHRYLMMLDGDALAATIGLYLRDTYVERFGDVTGEHLASLLVDAGAADRYATTDLREVTKLVVTRSYRGRGLSPLMLGCAHARAFAQGDDARTPLMVFCAKQSIVRNVYAPAGLRTRVIKPFPFYRVHELYRSEADPMESRLIIPDLDIPSRWYDLELPTELDTATITMEPT